MKLRELRWAAGLTQAETAKRSGLGLRLYQRYESGEVSISRVEFKKIVDLSRVLGCPLEKLIDWE